MDVDKILFRGKVTDAFDMGHVTGRWIHGYLVIVEEREYCCESIKHYQIITGAANLIGPGEYDPYEVFEVDPETVGQYIGRDDMDGNPIFTDDLIECRWRHCAEDVDKIARVISDSCIDDGLGRQWPNGTYNCKVIGNIYDNPDIWGKVQEVGREKREKWYKAHEEEMSWTKRD